jgi:hypothetical protein
MSFFGPMKYNNYNKISVLIYIVLFLLCFYLGYLAANRYKIVLFKKPLLPEKVIEKKRIIFEKKLFRFISLSISIALLSISLEFIEILLKNPSAFSITNMASNYIAVREELGSTNYSFPLIFRFLTGFFRNVSIILSFYYWKKIKRRDKKKLAIYLLLLFFVNMIAYGTQKFIGDLTIYILVVLAIKYLDANIKMNKKYIVFGSILLIIAILFFAFVQSQRYELIGVTVQNFGYRSGGYQYFDENHIIFKIFGYKYGLGLAVLLTGYLSAGYYGLSLCFNLPFEWTYGIGNSYFMSKLVSLIFQVPNIYERTYLNKLTVYYGRDGLRTWNTIFPWLASDFTFLGVLLIFIIVGYIWQTSWIEVLKYRNPVSIILFATISLGLVFIPANNQLFNGIDTYISTLFTIIFWIFNHKKYNIHQGYSSTGMNSNRGRIKNI